MSASNNAVQEQSLSLSLKAWTGLGLVRPECVLANSRGDLFTADWRGGVAHMHSDGSQTFYAAQPIDGEVLKPNGIALRKDGSFLLAHLGAELGGVFSLQRDGSTRPVLREVDGIALPPTNYPLEDAQGRLWITISTRLKPRALGYRNTCSDGFIVCMDDPNDPKSARIAADGLGYTNEIAFDPTGQWLYVNETFTRRLSRFPVRPDGSLGSKEVVTEFGAGTYPDGMAFDVEGHVWIVSIVSNRLIRVSPSGEQTIYLEDVDANHLAWVEEAYQSHSMGRPHLDGVKSKQLSNISSLAFGGKDLRTGYLGCLLGESLATLHMPVAGHPPIHWNY
ncbi:SMP-30/gluconolactonase/LRE family protein [Variovorax sp. PCZ-1]|uniref:SMP-30/gluconolactonase/LRE family protein n=1 Tax=Variovorax sp. PCZ-1 TaxID=2835533 RepID=UPI001BCE78C0|nr:SMP-30/gluconolactonase/LRE family protein [Variovorax sp. PCZ-1]MBS7807471.1 SMP-30/gluconolactonase/LRE family protein [Variovorax sp. PCZ-1]